MIWDIGFAVGWVLAGAAIMFAARCYRELHSWARQCQNARIAIAYNNRVKLQAPLVEWLLWTRKLDEDERSNGRVIYRANKVSVSIVSPPPKVKPRRLARLFDAYRAVKAARPSRRASGAPAA